MGAAWLPLGFHAVDRWVRLGRRWGLVELAIVLAMQTLGGDPQSAYILGWAAGGYAAGIAWSRARQDDTQGGNPRDSGLAASSVRWSVPLVVFGLLFWVAATLALAIWLPQMRPRGLAPTALPWMAWCQRGYGGLGIGRRGFSLLLADAVGGSPWASPGWDWLVSAGLAILLTAAQLLPVIEFTQRTTRAPSRARTTSIWFSIEPFRLVELLWPNVHGCPVSRGTRTGLTP